MQRRFFTIVVAVSLISLSAGAQVYFSDNFESSAESERKWEGNLVN